MIIGIGTDIVSIARLRRALERGGAHFRDHAFTPEESAAALAQKDALPRFAGRWAAKEALAKALGTGCGEHCSWNEISITNASNGKPEMRLSGRTLATFERLGGEMLHLSISHEQEYACATVVIEGKVEKHE